MFSIFEIAALLLTMTAVFSWLNIYLIHLPQTIGLLLMALLASLVLLGVEELFPSLGLVATLKSFLGQIDFHKAVLNGMLAFLLFAGGLHVDFMRLRDERWAVALMASLGVVISTVLIGLAAWQAARILGYDLPLAWAMVFGALISPTDPVAVLGLLKTISLPQSLEAKIGGESLFNDGVGVVVFTILLAVALGDHQGSELSGAIRVAQLFFLEAGGGALLGLISGWLAYRAMAKIDHHTVEILISLAAATATYALALRLDVSGPIAVVAAGLLVGNRGARIGMSKNTQRYLFSFWELIDELLNSVLFLLIGLEVVVLNLDISLAWFALACVPIALVSRLISVAVPLSIVAIRETFPAGTIPVLTWGGLRGGISVALALSLPAFDARPLVLTATYTVVVFSIIVQGLSIKWVIRKTVDPEMLEEPAPN